MCKCTCRRGAQGEQGPAGASSFTIQRTVIASTPVNAATDIPVVVSVPANGSMFFWGQLQIHSDASVVATVTLVINGTPTANVFVAVTSGSASDYYLVIPVSDLTAVTAGDTVAINVALNDYAQNTTVEGRVQFDYQ